MRLFKRGNRVGRRVQSESHDEVREVDLRVRRLELVMETLETQLELFDLEKRKVKDAGSHT
jgi:hypothetical protein